MQRECGPLLPQLEEKSGHEGGTERAQPSGACCLTDCPTRWGSTQKMIARSPGTTKCFVEDFLYRLNLLPPWQNLEVLESVHKVLQDFTWCPVRWTLCMDFLPENYSASLALAEQTENSDLAKPLKENCLSKKSETSAEHDNIPRPNTSLS